MDSDKHGTPPQSIDEYIARRPDNLNFLNSIF